MNRRLAKLAAIDPASARQIEPYVAGCPVTPSAPWEREVLREQFSRWASEAKGGVEPEVIVALGAGRGAELDALMDCLPQDCRVFLLEYDPSRAAGAFLKTRMEAYVETGRLTLAFGDDKECIQQRFISVWDMQQSPNMRVVDLSVNSSEADRFYADVLKETAKGVLLNIFNMGTLICRGVLWQFNTIKNLPYLLVNPGVASLENAFSGKPAIVVGAGPSLNEALPFIKATRRGFVLITTATALKALRMAGITPDLVVAVDAHPLTAQQFEAPCDDLYLACSTLVFPPAIPKFRGVFSGTLSANPIDRWLNGIVDPPGDLLAAGTVTSTAIDLAVKMGCNPVVSVGFDLSLKDDGTTHASNTMYHGVKLETDYHELTHVPGNYQDQVLTTHQFKNYIDLLADYLPRHPEVQFVNATGAGARIKGMKLVPPRELELFAAPPFDARNIIVSRHRAGSKDRRSAVRGELERVLPPLEKIMSEGREAAYLCNRLIMLLRRPQGGDEDTAREIMLRQEEIDRNLTSHKEASLLIEMSLWPAAHELGVRRLDEENRLGKAILANRRWRDFYEQIAGAARWTRDLVGEVLDELGNGKTGVRHEVGTVRTSRVSERQPVLVG